MEFSNEPMTQPEAVSPAFSNTYRCVVIVAVMLLKISFVVPFYSLFIVCVFLIVCDYVSNLLLMFAKIDLKISIATKIFVFYFKGAMYTFGICTLNGSHATESTLVIKHI